MGRLISRQRGGLAAHKLTKLFGINDFPAAKNSGKVLIIIIYCYLIIIIIIIIIVCNFGLWLLAQYVYLLISMSEFIRDFCNYIKSNWLTFQKKKITHIT